MEIRGTAAERQKGSSKMAETKLTVIYPQIKGSEKGRDRLDQVLGKVLKEENTEIFEDMNILWKENGEPYEGFCGKRVLFVIPLGKNGINREYYEVLSWLRSGVSVLKDSVGGMVIDADSELYTKAAARELAVAANQAGCAFVGRPLVEGTASLDNFLVQADNMNTDRLGAYKKSAEILAGQLREFSWNCYEKPNLLVLHASNHKTSNTLAIWETIRTRLDREQIEITEINLRNGTMEDCSGCPYQMCLHFGERGRCFYGGAMVDDVYPAVKKANGILLLCPNYNDAISANMTACINRLTALFRTTRFYDKALFAVIVSGYSGSDLLAGQLITALNMNKSFYLPGNFCMMETANKAGSALKLPGILNRIDGFAGQIISVLKGHNLNQTKNTGK